MIRLLLAAALSAPAQTSCLSRVAGEVEGLRGAFPRLNGLTLALEPYTGKDSFFEARPRGFWKSPAERVYVVRVNERLCDDPPQEEAEKAILTHELAHLDAYAAMSARSLVSLGWTYLVSPGSARVEAFEKAADDAVVRLGRAEGLARYREWLYPRLDAKALERKRRLYRTPEELRRPLTDKSQTAIISR